MNSLRTPLIANMTLGKLSAMLGLGFSICASILNASAATITSDTFSLGYGFSNSGSGGTWNTLETSGGNTPTMIGDFNFNPVVNGLELSSGGVYFPDRVLTDGGNGAFSAYQTSMTISGSWNGVTPVDAAPQPNYRLTLYVTSISIWAHNWGGVVETWFEETTAGNGAISPKIYAPNSNAFEDASDYSQLIWNPGGFSLDGTSVSRSFLVTDTNGGGSDAGFTILDGFAITGYVTLTYDAVPEPGSLGMLAAGATFLLLMAGLKRRRKTSV